MDETNDNGYQCLRIKVINRDHFNTESYKEIMMNADNLYESALLAIKSSKDKYQTKKFSRHIFEHISLAQKELLNQTWEIENVKPFLISERGHKRKIQGNTPHDRMIMNCFCNKILIPAQTLTERAILRRKVSRTSILRGCVGGLASPLRIRIA